MALSQDLCRCGHDRRVHGVFGQVCVACDCQGFSRMQVYQNRGPRVSLFLRRLMRRETWER